MEYLSHSLKETQKIASDFALSLSPKKGAVVVGLYGDLGGGKTSFTQGVANAFGISNNVVSPTFVIEKIYPIRTDGRSRPASNGTGEFSRLIHIDAYRIEKSEELLHLGWQEIISDPDNIILIEWPERVADIMPEHIMVKFEHVSENERKIEVIV